jgi:ATP-dependent RNA helicase RhlE
MMFSATIPQQIVDLADQILVKPAKISVDPPASPVDTIDSSVFFVEQDDKFSLLSHILTTEEIKKALVFMKTKHSADRLVKKLRKERIRSDAIHSDKAQHLREKALKDFKFGEISVLVATDVAARGIDVNDITHIINYDMSAEAEIYIHRIGRTARVGKSGIAYNFCAERERRYLASIEQLIKQHLIRAKEYPFMSYIPAPEKTDLTGKRE